MSRPSKRQRAADEIARQLDATERSGTATPEDLARLHAELEFTEAEERRIDPPTVSNVPPYYFNTGRCLFGDGDVTGMEIADGDIRLVRWPDDDHRPLPKTLARRSLRQIVDAVARH
jgi:hypothetical protein